MHNETLSAWTIVIGASIAICLFVYFIGCYPLWQGIKVEDMDLDLEVDSTEVAVIVPMDVADGISASLGLNDDWEVTRGLDGREKMFIRGFMSFPDEVEALIRKIDEIGPPAELPVGTKSATAI